MPTASPYARAVLALAALGVAGLFTPLAAEPPPAVTHWPQFRGPNAAGVAPDGVKLPTRFGPADNVVWKTPLPRGHSSPCVWGDRLFLTGFDAQAKKLETLCLDRTNGKILWRQSAPATTVEKVHQANSPAASTPATDGERVYVYFGSFGLLCYDFAGKELWQAPLPVPKMRFGSGSSPVVVGDRVLLVVESLPKPYLLAVDRRTGKTAWSKDRLPAGDGTATPVLWAHDGTEDVVTLGPGKISGHDPADGAERWYVNMASTACTTPVVGDGRLYVAAYMIGGEADERVKLPTFEELLEKYDADKDGEVSKAEFPKDLSFLRRPEAAGVPGADVKLIWFFDQLDLNKDGKLAKAEWGLVSLFADRKVEHAVMAIKGGGKGNVSKTHVVWKETKAVPEVASPLFYRGKVYAVRDGGVLSCLDAASGKLLYRERLGSAGAYFSSPIAGDGKVYAASLPGVMTVLAAGEKFEVLARNDLGESITATPAIAGGTLYVRTEKHLYAFKE